MAWKLKNIAKINLLYFICLHNFILFLRFLIFRIVFGQTCYGTTVPSMYSMKLNA